MGLPTSYAARNVLRRPWRTALTVGGVAVVVCAAVMMLALSRGLVARLAATGEPENILAISRKGQNNMFSSIDDEEVLALWSLPGLASSATGEVLVSPELMHMPFITCTHGDRTVRAPASVRGVNPLAFDVHRSVRVVEGRSPAESFEIIAGVDAYHKLGVSREALALGATVQFENRSWMVVGVFDAGGALFESEIWAREADLMTVLRRRTHSFVVARCQDAAAAAAAASHFERSGAIERFFKGWLEVDYYREFLKALEWVHWLSVFMVAAVVIAGALIGINTMYSAIVNRLSEIAVQRVLGFGGGAIVASLTVEAVILSMAGGLLGVLLGLLVNGMPMSLSQGTFFLVVDAQVLAVALALSVGIGVIGALIPSVKGVRMGILEAMRHG